MEYIDSLKTR